MAQKMADGDLTQQLDIDQKDEVGILAKSLNDMSFKLRQMFNDIAIGTQTLTASSKELSTVSEQISTNAEQTAEKSNNVAAAAEEMSTNMNKCCCSNRANHGEYPDDRIGSRKNDRNNSRRFQ